MFKFKIFLISMTVLSLFTSTVLFVVGIAISCTKEAIEIHPDFQKTSKIASFVVAGIHALIALTCGFCTYKINRLNDSRLNT